MVPEFIFAPNKYDSKQRFVDLMYIRMEIRRF